MFGILKNNNALSSYILAALFICFPLREALAYAPVSLNFYIRGGDILLFMAPFLYFVSIKNKEKNAPLSNIMMFFTAYSLLVGCVLGSYVDSSYAWKFVVKAFCIAMLLRLVEKNEFQIGPRFFDKLFKYVVLLQVPFMILQFLGYTIWGGHLVEYNKISFDALRFCGTASEPGFLIPLLTPCYYYYMCKLREHRYLFVLTLAMLVMSTSSYGYFVIVGVPSVYLLQQRHNKFKIILGMAVAIFFLSIGLYILAPQIFHNVLSSAQKVMAYGTNNLADMDWSAAERFENRVAGIRGFKELTTVEQLLGGGLGTAKYFAERYVLYHLPSEECGIAYLGLLLNLGVLGIMVFSYLYYRIYKYRTNNVYSNTFLVGVFFQAIQFGIIAGVWVYLFWFELAFLILIYNNRYRFETV